MLNLNFVKTKRSRARRFRTAGFTFIELLVVIAIIGIIAGIISVTVASYAARQSLNATQQQVIEGVENARRNTLASLNDTIYGVYVGTSSIAFFEGASYSPNNPNNEYLPYTGKVTATSSFTGGVTSVVFDRLNGEPSAAGTIVLFDSGTMSYATVTISAAGLVE